MNSPYEAIYVWGLSEFSISWIKRPFILLPSLSWRKIVKVSTGEINFFSFKMDECIPDDLISIILCLISFNEKGVTYSERKLDKR